MNDFTAFRESPAYRGNIHCHSTVSDGALTPHELVRRYREHGWSFLALSEHNTWSDYGGSLDSNDFITIPAMELSVLWYKEEGSPSLIKAHHIQLLADHGQGPYKHMEVVDFPKLHGPDADFVGLVQAVIDAHKGMVIGINHPSWSRVLDSDMLSRQPSISLANASVSTSARGIRLQPDTTVRYAVSPMGQNTLRTAENGEFFITLEDGTIVHLNYNTTLRYPEHFSSKERMVFLEGEAYFEVAPNAEQPFLVNTTRGCIQVLGTAFNVRDYVEEKKVVTVLESGKVRYTTAGKQQESRELRPGFLLEDAEGQQLHARQVNTRLYTEWRNGKYIFENASVEEIMSTLQRWYNIDVIYADEKVKQLHFTGDLERYETFDIFLHFMETGGDIRFQIKDNIVIVNKK